MARRDLFPAVGFNIELLESILASRGWLYIDLARSAGVSPMTVTRFMRGDSRTPPTAKKLVSAVGRSIDDFRLPARLDRLAFEALKRRAKAEVYRAVRKGDLARGSCAVCDSPNTEAHHDDYGKPLRVVWLCKRHHTAHHVDLRRAAAAGR